MPWTRLPDWKDALPSLSRAGFTTVALTLAEGAVPVEEAVAGVDRVSVVCTATHEIIDTVTVVEQPSCIAESADGKQLFIADYDGAVTALTVASSTESLLAKLVDSAVIDIPMLELEPVGV